MKDAVPRLLGQSETKWQISGDSVVWLEETAMLTLVATWFGSFGVKWGKNLQKKKSSSTSALKPFSLDICCF